MRERGREQKSALRFTAVQSAYHRVAHSAYIVLG